MGSVTVNPPKTPVTRGSHGMATATLPNVCKMPGPPAPFVPTPLPNIGKSDTSPSGYSKTVTMDGEAVAISGASFGSMGDVASKATGGGIVSMNCEGPTKFVGPGSFDVQVEGKNVQLLGDPMLNNCGPSGSPPNSATMTGVMQVSGGMTIIYGDDTNCPICKKTHPVQDGEEVGACLATVMSNLRERFEQQRPRIQELRQLTQELDEAQAAGSEISQRISVLLISERNSLISELAPVSVLRFDEGSGTFDNGYMIGAFTCGCRMDKKCLITTSGYSPPGFVRATEGSGFTFVGNTFAPTPAQLARIHEWNPKRNVWACAAPKLIDAAAGHNASQMSEIMFTPLGAGPHVGIRVKMLDGTTKKLKKQYDSGAQVPSCRACQELLPAMLCQTKCN